MSEEVESDLTWEFGVRNNKHYGLSLNGAILYEITNEEEGEIYKVWFCPEETPNPIYLWSFFLLGAAKRYVDLREKKNRMNYTYTSSTAISDYAGENSK